MIPFQLENSPPYSLAPDEKDIFIRGTFFKMHLHQIKNCEEYRNLAAHFSLSDKSVISEYPFIPVTMFKEFDLRSTNSQTKLLMSSGTTGEVSRIYVDRKTGKRQSLSAYNILNDYIGKEPRPYLVFDSEETVRGSNMSARGAAIMSLANFASEIYFLMDSNKNGGVHLNMNRLQGVRKKIGDKPVIVYGFTSILWRAYGELAKKGIVIDSVHPGSLILHSGGWKRLTNLAVSKDEYNFSIAKYWGIKKENIIDFYGLIEQVGVLYPDCRAGFKHVPYWADILIRKADTLEEADLGETGLIHLISLLPLSSPSHSVLTQDLGRIELLDDCICGRRGKAFTFISRVESSPLRGCSDVYRSN